jgi:hypothetical protein
MIQLLTGLLVRAIAEDAAPGRTSGQRHELLVQAINMRNYCLVVQCIYMNLCNPEIEILMHNESFSG